MNSTIQAAWIAVVGVIIGVGGTVAVAIVGFRTTRKATESTNAAAIENVRAQIEADRLNRIWDERGRIYADILAAVQFRQTRRQFATQTDLVDEQTRQRAEAMLATFQPPDWYALEARSLAFSSEPVVTATQRSSTAELDCQVAVRSWQDLVAAAAPADEISMAAAAVAAARQAAEDADDALVEAIRDELIGKGRPVADWQPVPSASVGPAADRQSLTQDP